MRLGNAKLGRFMSPDNFIQDPYNTQSFNRYSYVWNNPLRYNDPSGEFLVTAFIIGAVAGAYFGGSQANGTYNPLKWKLNATTAFSMLSGAVIGGISSVAGAAAGAAALTASGVTGGILGGIISGGVGGFVGGGISGAFMSGLPGGNGDFFKGMLQGAVTGLVGGALIGGAISGIGAAIKGNNIWNGKEITKAVTNQPTANSLSKISENLDESLGNQTTSTEISNNNGITKSTAPQGISNKINNAIPDSGPIHYKSDYLKPHGVDGTHNWSRTSIEIVADNGVIFPESIGKDGIKQILIQHDGVKHGVKGIFELIIRDNAVHHQRFIPNGVINGIPNQPFQRLPKGTFNPIKWWK